MLRYGSRPICIKSENSHNSDAKKRLLRIFYCLFAFLVLDPFPLPTFWVSYFFLASIKSWATYTGHERPAEIEPTILDEINETSGPPLSQLQCCQNGAFLLFRAFIIALGEKGENCSVLFCPRLKLIMGKAWKWALVIGTMGHFTTILFIKTDNVF